MSVRVIARLDIKGPNLVKGVHLEGLRVLGRPERFAEHYYRAGIDELVYMDVVASLYGRNSLLPVVERTAREIFIPLTVGGGIRTIDDIRDVLRAGADKVSLNTAAIAEPELIRRASRRFGSSTIVVSIEAVRHPHGGYEAFTSNGRDESGLDAIEWATAAADLGAGELMITSVDREGTGKGYDVELVQQVCAAVDVPVTVCGGAGTAAHVVEVCETCRPSAVGVAALLHYGAVYEIEHVADDFESEGNLEFLQTLRAPRQIEPVTVAALKRALLAAGVECRPPAEHLHAS